VIIGLPDWYLKAEKKLQKAIDDIVRENHIDWVFSHDSTDLNKAKETILDVLIRIDEQVKNPWHLTKEESEKLIKEVKEKK